MKQYIVMLGALAFFSLFSFCSQEGRRDGAGAETFLNLFGGEQAAQQGEILLTFHDTPVDGDTIEHIYLNVIETQIIDFSDARHTISTESHFFDLLEVRKNNPVVLAHTSVGAGTYKQIRIILDDSSTIVMKDGSSHPLVTPSGEQTGVKIDGVFTIAPGKLFTLDIDMDPGKSVHYADGNGYMLKPVVALEGSEILQGTFLYSGKVSKEDFTLSIKSNGKMSAITSRYPKYEVVGHYYYDGLERLFTVYPEDVKCHSCSYFEKLKLDMFGDLPDQQSYHVVSWGENFIDLLSEGRSYRLRREGTFELPPPLYPPKQFVISARVSDPALSGKIMVAVLYPENREGRGYTMVAPITDAQVSNLEFIIPGEELGGPVRPYILTMAIVESESDVTLRDNGAPPTLTNIVDTNFKNAIRLNVYRDVVATDPLALDFIPDGAASGW